MFFILFQYHADPCIRNLRAETPLDLACQYGRLESVEILLKKHPALLCDNVESHCPLHLASRNGHKQVVQVLIDSGFDLNTKVSEDFTLYARIYACMCLCASIVFHWCLTSPWSTGNIKMEEFAISMTDWMDTSMEIVIL